ncbi:uroporphyrinogen-III synthase HEM4 [Aspergillus fijiensis CBS 313.89]|uniref:Tetrapyrrole biosynthesis, uroporphyrinogen III synthase n=1 Tax=Aspergillus fijiensis CBS 313.89 TaxID=1448319 RepID=A0A8G1REL5_9EURO|nr:tetrapyrrole biosynthesis, uroporphyrinogen III synthase [Aspergillus fijiensis CBS 313.89]RAK71844.1 tetrapyrrole biosynthesis, uroporphyrinogen III synthase [Aspergillus fijiensis CBS 313.89]
MAEQDPRTPILLLKTRSTPHDGYDDFFTSQNYSPAFIPVLEHHFHTTNLQRIHDLLVSGGFRAGHPNQKYGGIIFTSQRAVEGFAHVLEGIDDPGRSLTPLTLPLYTVGPATHRSLSALTTTYLPNATLHGQDTGTGELLAHFILSHYPTYTTGNTTGNLDANTSPPNPQTQTPNHARKPLLFLVGEQRRDIIPKTLMDPARRPDARIPVEELVVYETGVMAGFEEAFGARIRAERDAFQRKQQDEDDEKVVWTVVFSPTGCEAMVRVLETVDASSSSSSSSSSSAVLGGGLESQNEDGDLGRKDNNRKFFVATIGPTTRDYLRNRVGFEPDVCAEKPSPEGVGRGIQKFMEEFRAGKN